MKISVIIPVWKEEAPAAAELGRHAQVIVCPPEGRPSRGGQMRRGAERAAGDLLLFLHADARLPEGWPDALRAAFASPDPPAAAAFSIDYGSPDWRLRAIESFQHWRCRAFQVAFGDHGLCVPRAVYDACGGMPDIPLMEDVAFCRRLRRLGRIQLLPQRLRLSPRRQLERGPLLNAARNLGLLALYRLGASPESLWKRYYSSS